MPKIKTFEDACKVKKLDPAKVIPDVSVFPAEHQKALIAAAKLFIIADAVNGAWKPDWNNNDQYKYFPWFDMEKTDYNPTGFRLLNAYCYYTASYVGSRLCFKSRAIAEEVGKQFVDLYKDLMVL